MNASFNGATSARSWKCNGDVGCDAEHAASMGPRARARGNNRGLVTRTHQLQASMGPRARARGNGLGERAEFAGSGASMGPRARARGNQTGLRRTTWVYLLQWGHERALVEMRMAPL